MLAAVLNPEPCAGGAGGKVLQSVAVAVDNGATPAQTSLPEVVLVLHHPSHCEELEYCRIVGKMAPQSSRRLTSALSTPRRIMSRPLTAFSMSSCVTSTSMSFRSGASVSGGA